MPPEAGPRRQASCARTPFTAAPKSPIRAAGASPDQGERGALRNIALTTEPVHDRRPSNRDSRGPQANRETRASRVLLGSLRQAPGLDRRGGRRPRLPRPQPPRRQAEGPAQGRHRPHRPPARRPRRLPRRHRPRLRHRRLRDGDVVAARRPPRRHAGLGELRRGLGHRRDQAAQARRRPRAHGPLRRPPRPRAGPPRRRRLLHLERHHLRRPRAERRLDRRRPRRPHPLRRDLRRLRPGPALGQARRHHLLLAEGDGRRGRATASSSSRPAPSSASRPSPRRARSRRSSA